MGTIAETIVERAIAQQKQAGIDRDYIAFEEGRFGSFLLFASAPLAGLVYVLSLAFAGVGILLFCLASAAAGENNLAKNQPESSLPTAAAH